MCITFFCCLPSSSQAPSFILGFNRQQQTQRQALQFGQFQQDPNIYGGKDIESGGTWLGINLQTGILVFITNYSMHLAVPRKGISRGKLVRHFLTTQFISKEKRNQADQIIIESLRQFSKASHEYSPFNLVVVNLRFGSAFYICSEKKELNPMILEQGIPYGLSNSDITAPWSKTTHGLQLFRQIIGKVDKLNEQQTLSQLTRLMKNKEKLQEIHPQMKSIFIEPYWSQRFNAQRRTKTTSLMLVYPRQNKKEIIFKEITYEEHGQQQILLRLNI